jgi:hypothetical protein
MKTVVAMPALLRNERLDRELNGVLAFRNDATGLRSSTRCLGVLDGPKKSVQKEQKIADYSLSTCDIFIGELCQ